MPRRKPKRRSDARAAGFSPKPPTDQPISNSSARDIHDQRHPSILDDQPLRIQRRMLHTNWLLVAVTAAYVAVTALQYLAFKAQIADAQRAAADSRRSADAALADARRGLQIDQRAWLGFTRTIRPKALSDRVLITLGLSNTGRTPAIAVEVSLHAVLLPAGNYDIIEAHVNKERMDQWSKGGATNDFIFPNVTDFVDGELNDRHRRRETLTPSQISDIQNGISTLYAHGRVDYRDIFDKRHWLLIPAKLM